jgi:hypothetical protein
VLTDPIGKAIGEHPVDPTLEDRRHGEPPEGKLENQCIGPQQLFDLGFDILGQRIGLECLFGSRDR